MTRATLSATLATLFLGACLVMSSGVVKAANQCKKDCGVNKKACVGTAKTALTACKTAAATDKIAKKACKDAFKLAKKNAKTNCKTDCVDKTATPRANPCSPSGAFLDASSALF